MVEIARPNSLLKSRGSSTRDNSLHMVARTHARRVREGERERERERERDRETERQRERERERERDVSTHVRI